MASARLREIHEQRGIDALEIKKADAVIERRLIRSPIDGVVTRVHRDQGEFVTVVSPTVVSVAQLDPLRVTLNLPTEMAAALKPAATMRLSLPEADQFVEARVELIAPVIEAESGTVRVKLLIDNRDGRLRAGMRCMLPLDVAKPTLSARLNP